MFLLAQQALRFTSSDAKALLNRSRFVHTAVVGTLSARLDSEAKRVLKSVLILSFNARNRNMHDWLQYKEHSESVFFHNEQMRFTDFLEKADKKLLETLTTVEQKYSGSIDPRDFQKFVEEYESCETLAQ